jgi:putative ABC transport system permease protein
MNVGTLVYARTATREGEIALRSALGASRARIIGQLFVEALVLASIAAVVGLMAADRTLTWGIESAFADKGGAPFWMTRGLELTTILYASGLAVVSAAMLSLLPALRATRSRVQSNLANLGTGGATLRFGRVWTSAMVAQVALTAIGIPVAMESASQSMRMRKSRAAFPSGDYLAARIDVDRPFDEETPSTFEDRRARTFAALERRIAPEPGVVGHFQRPRAGGHALENPRRRDRDVARQRASADIGGGPGIFRGIRSSNCRRAWLQRGRPESRRANGDRQ